MPVILVEAKWRSSEGSGQGKWKDKSQTQLRREFLEKHGRALFGDRAMAVLGVTWKEPVEPTPPADGGLVATRELRWEDLAGCSARPQADEFGRYLAWKAQHSKP